MNFRRDEAANRPKAEFVPKTLTDLNIDTLPITGTNSSDGLTNGGRFFTSHKSDHSSNGKFNNNNKNIDNNNMHQKKQSDNILNNNQYNLFSSQQNLSKTNIIQSNNNMIRNRHYGSQQSLSTVSNHSNSSNSISTKLPPFYQLQPHQMQQTQTDTLSTTTAIPNGKQLHRNSIDNDNTTDWLNAWNSPPSTKMATSTANPTTISSSSSIIRDLFPTPTASAYNNSNHTRNQLTSNATTTTVIKRMNTNSNSNLATSSTNNNHFSNLNSQNGFIGFPWTGDFFYLISFFFKFHLTLFISFTFISFV